MPDITLNLQTTVIPIAQLPPWNTRKLPLVLPRGVVWYLPEETEPGREASGV